MRRSARYSLLHHRSDRGIRSCPVRCRPTRPLPLGTRCGSRSAAAELGDEVGAIVSRGGRIDLAQSRIPSVRTPTLLVVGGDDPVVVALNRESKAEFTGEAQLEIVAGATHLFDEPGAIATVARLAADWFVHRLSPTPATGRPPA